MSQPISSPTLADVVNRGVDLRLLDLHTATVAEVQTYDAEKQTVDVKPQVKTYEEQESGDQVPAELAVLSGVKVLFPGANGFRITFPLTQGDTVLLVFAESSLDQWMARGGLVDPKDPRRHHLADAVAIPGLYPRTQPWSGASTTKLTIGKDGGPQLVITSAGLELGGSDTDTPTDNVALAQKVLDELNRVKQYMTVLDAALRVPANEPGNGAPSVFQTALSAALASVQYPSPNSVASSNVKSK